jgi:hypothetical protein
MTILLVLLTLAPLLLSTTLLLVAERDGPEMMARIAVM